MISLGLETAVEQNFVDNLRVKGKTQLAGMAIFLH